MSEIDPISDSDHALEAIDELARARGFTVGVAESLTGGQIANHLASVAGSSDWFCGGIVAFQKQVKFRLLDVPQTEAGDDSPVVTAAAASAMAGSTARLLHADVAVAVTGVGGPKTQDGEPAGTVFLAVCGPGTYEHAMRFRFDGEPEEVLEQTILAALEALRNAMREGAKK